MHIKDRLDFLIERWGDARPGLDTSPWAVCGRLTLINELFMARVGQLLKRHRLTFNEYQSLAAIYLSGPPYESSPNQIAHHNLLTSGGMTNLLNKMEAADLISRRPAEQDRRGVVVSLTAEGRERLDAALIDENGFEHEWISSLTAQEAEILSILLRKLLVSIESLPDRTENV
ncbi:MarR family winged helix-turn-helix transcriptional regulator [Lichenicoccus sp.]|uniref:MarR family winged helix-turn-helix transcriptional regulator n=1 Tax=Lichenicoccus sp. TaxID=2781899 RepID=UPI003D148A8D